MTTTLGNLLHAITSLADERRGELGDRAGDNILAAEAVLALRDAQRSMSHAKDALARVPTDNDQAG